MIYTYQMFKKDFPNLKKEHFHSMRFYYAVALQPIKKWDGNWNNKESFMMTSVKGGGCDWIYGFNAKADVKQFEVFICAQSAHLRTAVRATGVNTMSYMPRPTVRKSGQLDLRVMSYLKKKQLRQERPMYDWYEKELSKIDLKIRETTREMNENICFWSAEKKENHTEYKYKAVDKRIKTNYGEEVKAYESDFTKVGSPFDGEKYLNFDQIKRAFLNADEFKGVSFPLYRQSHNGVTYLFEKCDFEEIKNEDVEDQAVAIVSKWEDQLIELERQGKAITRWKNRIMKNIENKVYEKFPEYHPALKKNGLGRRAR